MSTPYRTAPVPSYPEEPSMRNWLEHIHRSPFCFRTYPGTFTPDGRAACPCGWQEQEGAHNRRAQSAEYRCGEFPSIVRENAERNPNYAPYCMRCDTLKRMDKKAPFFWKCGECGAIHDERTVVEVLAQLEAKKEQGNWYPAHGGTEVPFITRSGRRLMYCYQPSSGKHAYLDCDTDMILSDEDAQLAMGK